MRVLSVAAPVFCYNIDIYRNNNCLFSLIRILVSIAGVLSALISLIVFAWSGPCPQHDWSSFTNMENRILTTFSKSVKIFLTLQARQFKISLWSQVLLILLTQLSCSNTVSRGLAQSLSPVNSTPRYRVKRRLTYTIIYCYMRYHSVHTMMCNGM